MLRSQVIRLAYTNPEMREHLLPILGLLKSAVGKWAYHATMEDRLPSIIQHGLVPGAAPRLRGAFEPDALFVADDLEWVLHYGDADTYLRFPFPQDTTPDRHPTSNRVLPHQFMSFKTVSPASIEVLVDEDWLPLVKWFKSQR